MATDMDKQMDRDVSHQIATKPLEECAAHGVRNMIDGAIGVLMVNLGHPLPMNPCLTAEYGHRLFGAALKAMQPKPPAVERDEKEQACMEALR